MTHDMDKERELLLDEPQEKEDYSNVQIEEYKLGVWTMKVATELGLNPRRLWKNVQGDIPLFWRLALDILNTSPWLLTIYFICQIWRGIEDSVSLHLSNNLLKAIESSIMAGKPQTRELILSVVSRLLCTQLIAFVAWYGDKAEERVATCVTRHFELILLKAKLETDLPTSKTAASKQKLSASSAWTSLEHILSFYRTLLETVSMMILIMHISRSAGGPLFALLCASQPLFSAIMTSNLWSKVTIGYIHDLTYQRMKSLETLVYSDTFKQDIVSGNLVKWISTEFGKSHEKLGTTSDMHPFSQFHRIGQKFLSSNFQAILGDLPMMFCAFSVFMNPAQFSVSSIAILQSSSTRLQYSFMIAVNSGRQFRQSSAAIKEIYDATMVRNTMRAGDIPYPRPLGSESEKSLATGYTKVCKGMSFQLRDISFSYVGSKKTSPALNCVSLTIQPGQLVVIVGANGSGKSTLIRILSRLYDPTSGEVLIDGLPCSQYRIGDLHRATALLSQDNNIYPLSLRENIGLGNPQCSSDSDMVTKAAKLGGSLELIEKLEKGMETTLDPYRDVWSHNVYGCRDHPLYKEMEAIEKTVDVSGGEKQRIVASRSFMRLMSGDVNFVAVDEPSSALDAEGEIQLFQNLLAVRGGKTMIFVTHRFGHLTKEADLIVCMKDGDIVESGTHTELMEKNGEYAGLYNIQASAFSSVSTTS